MKRKGNPRLGKIAKKCAKKNQPGTKSFGICIRKSFKKK